MLIFSRVNQLSSILLLNCSQLKVKIELNPLINQPFSYRKTGKIKGIIL